MKPPRPIVAQIDKHNYQSAKARCKELAVNKGGVWHVTRNEDGLWLAVVDRVLANNTALKSYFWHNEHSKNKPDKRVINAEWYEKIFARL